ARGRKRLVKLATRALTQLRRRIWGVVPTNSLFSPEYPTFYLLSKVIEGAIRHHKAGEVLFTYEGYAPEYRDLLSRMEIDCVDLENLTRRTSKEGTTSWSRYASVVIYTRAAKVAEVCRILEQCVQAAE